MTQKRSHLTFCFDHMSSPNVLGYPNLAKIGLQPDEFDHTRPRAIPCRLFVYFKRHGIEANQCSTDQAPPGSWYPIAVAWFDFSCDYFHLMPQQTLDLVRTGIIKILFYYHEGDNPADIKKRLDQLTDQHGLKRDCYTFISANSVATAQDLIYFPDHEYFFHYVNRRQTADLCVTDQRPFAFTALNRSHKWWRASVMADLQQRGLLSNSLWSYNTKIDIGDCSDQNPLQLDSVQGWRQCVKQFVDRGPYSCDTMAPAQHNDHRLVNIELYTQSYFHLILETHFDADGSGGTFITEKTYKCLKFGQPFVIIGPPGSLSVLRAHGYRVFDGIIDNSYDLVQDNTERWHVIKRTIDTMVASDMHELFVRCVPDVLHNQRHFQEGNRDTLKSLAQRLTVNFDTV